MREFDLRDVRAVMNDRVFDGVFAGAGNIRKVKTLRGRRDFGPLYFGGRKRAQLDFQGLNDASPVRKIVFDDVIETAEESAVKNEYMVCGGDDQAVGMVLFD